MTNQNPQPATLRFDESKNFSDNSKSFLASIENVDTDMVAILRDNWDALVAIVCMGERDLKARAEFNSKVTSALDSLLNPPEPKTKSGT